MGITSNNPVDDTIQVDNTFQEVGNHAPKAEQPEGNGSCNNQKIGCAVIGFALVAVIVIVSVYFATRPEDIPITTTTQEESLASLIKVAPFLSGAVLLEFTELLDDPTTLFYYLNIQDFNFTTAAQQLGANNIDNVDLYLTASPTPMAASAQQEDDRTVRIGNVASVGFPFRLPDGFLPGDYNGILLLEEDDDASASVVELAAASFDVIVDPSRNIGSPEEEEEGGGSAPVAPELPPILFSNLDSEDYNIDGTITVDYVSDFVNGNVVTRARMRFDIPEAARAPGPFLYLSKRPYSQSRGRRLDSSDIPIPMDQTGGGSFTIEGVYDQILDEIGNVQNLSEYTNGSWIVWCEPFSIWLGGGPISPQS